MLACFWLFAFKCIFVPIECKKLNMASIESWAKFDICILCPPQLLSNVKVSCGQEPIVFMCFVSYLWAHTEICLVSLSQYWKKLFWVSLIYLPSFHIVAQFLARWRVQRAVITMARHCKSATAGLFLHKNIATTHNELQYVLGERDQIAVKKKSPTNQQKVTKIKTQPLPGYHHLTLFWSYLLHWKLDPSSL